MKITFSLITKKIFHADTSYLSQIMSINWALLRKCNCDLGPSQGHQMEGQTHRTYLKLALNHLNTLLMHQWLCLTQLMYFYC